MGNIFTQADSGIMNGFGKVRNIFGRHVRSEAKKTAKSAIWHEIRRKVNNGIRSKPYKTGSTRRNEEGIELMNMKNKNPVILNEQIGPNNNERSKINAGNNRNGKGKGNGNGTGIGNSNGNGNGTGTGIGTGTGNGKGIGNSIGIGNGNNPISSTPTLPPKQNTLPKETSGGSRKKSKKSLY